MIQLLFWSLIILSIIISAAGIAVNRPAFLILAALLAVPFTWYLGMTPRFEVWGMFLPLLQLGGALAISKKMPWLALLLLIPLVSLVIWLVSVVA